MVAPRCLNSNNMSFGRDALSQEDNSSKQTAGAIALPQPDQKGHRRRDHTSSRSKIGLLDRPFVLMDKTPQR